MLEAGVKDYSPTNWFGLLAPRGLDKAVLMQIHSALIAGFRDPEARKSLTAKGVDPVFNDPGQFRLELAADQERWRTVTRNANIILE